MTHIVLLRVMFIDAGPTRSAWVVLEVRRYENGSTCLVPVQGGWGSMNDDAWLGGLMVSTWESGGVVGLEYIDGGLYDRKRWRNLLETSRVEGEIRRSARIRGAESALLPFAEMPGRRALAPRTLFCVPATSWRAELCHRDKPSDAEIEVVVLHLAGKRVEVRPGVTKAILDLPGVNHENREHLMDAMGGAIVLAATFLGSRLVVPDEVRAAQARARAAVYEGARARRLAKQLGVDPSRLTTAAGAPAVKIARARGVRAGERAVGANTRARRRKGGA